MELSGQQFRFEAIHLAGSCSKLNKTNKYLIEKKPGVETSRRQAAVQHGLPFASGTMITERLYNAGEVKTIPKMRACLSV